MAEKAKTVEGEVEAPETRESTTALKHLMAPLVRKEKLNGKTYLVAPTILIVEGVHNKVFYPAEELAKFPDAWNGRPVTIQHPNKAGEPVTANSPKVAEGQTVGMLYNTKFQDGKLKSEVWVDEELAKKHDPALLKAIEKGKRIEVSTGMFTEDLIANGIWNGEDYVATATNIRPDHLALLPGGKGACSWEDGAGVPRLNEEEAEMNFEALRQRASELGLAVLQLTFTDMRKLVVDAVSGLFKPEQMPIVSDMFDNAVIVDVVEKDAAGMMKSKLLKVGYEVDEKGMNVKFKGEPILVERKSVYVPVGEVKMNEQEEEKKHMDRKARIEALVALKAIEATDAALYEKLDDVAFAKVEAAFKANAALQKENAEVKAAVEAGKVEITALKTNALKTPKTIAEVIAAAPEALRPDLQRAVDRDVAIKAEGIKALLANPRNKFSADELNAKSLKELEQLAELGNILVDFSGKAVGQPKTNVAKEEEPAPAMPKLFAAKAEEKK